MKKSIESNSKELADAFNYGAKSVVKSVNKDKIMAWWKASASDEVCGGDGTEAKATKYEKFCAAITMADNKAAGRQGRHDPEADAGCPGNDCGYQCPD